VTGWPPRLVQGVGSLVVSVPEIVADDPLTSVETPV
jgi:hypothetical protein